MFLNKSSSELFGKSVLDMRAKIGQDSLNTSLFMNYTSFLTLAEINKIFSVFDHCLSQSQSQCSYTV